MMYRSRPPLLEITADRVRSGLRAPDIPVEGRSPVSTISTSERTLFPDADLCIDDDAAALPFGNNERVDIDVDDLRVLDQQA